ncbi:MAG: CDP-alcohol phosphatidyltransferase family protein [bacterium]|nr:CDP-alcohol phosphatidyltransferase family protein [bacterium]
MKYSFRYVLENRRDPNEGIEKKIADYHVVLSAVTKTLSPFPTYIFLNLGIKPDWVTLASILALIFGAFFFVLGHVVLGVVAILCFAMLDSMDGDMARCIGTTSYGATLDSFGADFFYALIPVSLGYHLYSIGATAGPLDPEMVFLTSVLVSITLILHRLIRTKHLLFFSGKNSNGGSIEYKVTPSRHDSLSSVLKNYFLRFIKFSRSTIIRNNFFAEPGMLLFFSIFSIFERWDWLVAYLTILLLYNAGFLVQNFAHAYISFIEYERKK